MEIEGLVSIMEISIRPLEESDLPEADRIFRLAFGTFLNVPDPIQFFGDADYVRSRFLADPSAAYGAEAINDGSSSSGGGKKKLVGFNFTTNWGSVGFFGPLTIHPEFWAKGIAKRLLESTIDLFSNWNTKHAGLFTFAQSPKHIALYQKFDFWPRFLTTIMSKNVISKEKKENNNNTANLRWSRYSELFGKKRELDNKQQRGEEENQEEGKYLDVCSRLTHAIYEGLDLRVEIMSVRKQELGDTVLLWDDENTSDDNYSKILVGIGICHCGAGSEAGSNTCYIKFGAVKPGPAAGNNFDKLLDACEAFAAEEGMSSIVAGVNTGRYEAYRKMLSRGFQIDILGIAMQRYNDSGYNKRNVYVIDDWR